MVQTKRLATGSCSPGKMSPPVSVSAALQNHAVAASAINGDRAGLRIDHPHRATAGAEPVLHFRQHFARTIVGRKDLDRQIGSAGEEPLRQRFADAIGADESRIRRRTVSGSEAILKPVSAPKTTPKACVSTKSSKRWAILAAIAPCRDPAGDIIISSPCTSSHRPSSGAWNNCSAVVMCSTVAITEVYRRAARPKRRTPPSPLSLWERVRVRAVGET